MDKFNANQFIIYIIISYVITKKIYQTFHAPNSLYNLHFSYNMSLCHKDFHLPLASPSLLIVNEKLKSHDGEMIQINLPPPKQHN
jgi:hypothetical protein